MKECACGVLILDEWTDCGAPACVKRTLDLDSGRDLRTWRFKSLRQVTDFNRNATIELHGRTQEFAFLLRRKVEAGILHENIGAMYRRMRHEDVLDDYGRKLKDDD